MVPLKQIEYGFGYITSIYFRGTIGVPLYFERNSNFGALGTNLAYVAVASVMGPLAGAGNKAVLNTSLLHLNSTGA